MTDADLLEEILVEWEERFDAGIDASPEQLCPAGRPELLSSLVREISKLKRMRDVQATLPDQAAPESTADNAEPEPPNETAISGVRYRPLQLIDEGGLGQVFLARDEELGRDVAVKRIRSERLTPDAVERFRREGEITGRLEHPGIVPVYGLGTDSAGQPYYAMRFVRGQTLRAAIKAYHSGAGDAPQRRLALRNLLSRVIAACNGVAYAHSRGVIHRDLKPANIMLGKYGETLIVDWGLAKFVGRDEAHHVAGEESISPPASDDSAPTQFGHAMGTPAYMSPEQANGDWATVGPSSDVFSMGAVLYSVLTGQAPYSGNYSATVLDKAKRCDYPPPRQVRPETPPALDAICRKAMSRNVGDRYATALKLAADVELWLADELVTAYREPAAARAWRWMRGHRTFVAGVAVALPLLLLAAIAWAVISHRHNRDLDRERNAAFAARDEAEENFRLAVANSVTTGTLAGELKVLAGSNRKSLERILSASESALTNLVARTTHTAVVREQQGQTLNSLAEMYLELGDVAAAEDRARKALSINEALAAANAEDDRRQSALAFSCARLAAAKFFAGDSTSAIDLHRRALAIRRRLAERSPDSAERLAEVAQSLMSIGTVSGARLDQPAEWAAIEEALAIRRKLTENSSAPPNARADLAQSLQYWSQVAAARGDSQAAQSAITLAHELADALVAEEPGNGAWSFLLADILKSVGLSLQSAGQTIEAARIYNRSLDLCDAFLRLDPENQKWFKTRNFVAARANDLLLPGQEAATRASIQRLEALAVKLNGLAGRYPQNAIIRDDLAAIRIALGDHYWSMAQHDNSTAGQDRSQALKWYRLALSNCDELTRLDPDRGAWIQSFHALSGSFALKLKVLGLMEEHRRVSEHGLRLWLAYCEGQLQRDPTSPLRKANLAAALSKQSQFFEDHNQINEARQSHKRSAELYEQAVAQLPGQKDWLWFAAQQWSQAAFSCGTLKDSAGRVAARKREYHLRKRYLEADPSDIERQQALFNCLDNLSLAFSAAGQKAEAQETWGKARAAWAESLTAQVATVVAPRTQPNTISLANIEDTDRANRLDKFRDLIKSYEKSFAVTPTARKALQLTDAQLDLARRLKPSVPAEAAEIRQLLVQIKETFGKIQSSVELIPEEERCVAAVESVLKNFPPLDRK